MKKLLFVCTGNTCRSPMAAAIFNKLAAERGVDALAESAGLNVRSEGPASGNAILAASDLGIDLSSHVSRQVTNKMIDEADRIYTMTSYQAQLLGSMAPSAAAKISPLSDMNIIDPFGGSLEIYRRTAKQLLDAVGFIL